MSWTPRRRSTRGELTHIKFAIADALNFIQSTVEFRAEQDGDLAGPILPEQKRWSRRLDQIETLRGELESEELGP